MLVYQVYQRVNHLSMAFVGLNPSDQNMFSGSMEGPWQLRTMCICTIELSAEIETLHSIKWDRNVFPGWYGWCFINQFSGFHFFDKMTGENGKSGILGQFMLVCCLFWFLCFCSTCFPYLWCSMCWGFWDYCDAKVICWCLVWIRVGFVEVVMF